MKRKALFLLSVLTIFATILSGCNSADSVDSSETIETTAIESEATEETEIITETVEEIETETTSGDDLGLGETPPYEIVDQGDYPDTRSDHQEAWDNFKENWNESDYGTTTAGKIANDFPYYGPTGYSARNLEDRTTDKGYTVKYDINTGRVYYSGMMLPTGSIWDDAESGGVLSAYAYNKGYNSLYDLTYAEMQELLGVYNGD